VTIPQPTETPADTGIPVQAPRTEALAIVGVISAFLFWPAGLVINPLALGRVRRNGTNGRGLALAGLIVSIAAAVICIISIVGSMVAASTVSQVFLDDVSPTATPAEELHNYAPVTSTGKVGELIPSGSGRAYMVRDLECGIESVGESPFERTPDGQFCRIGVTYANISDDEIEVSGGDTSAFIGTTGYSADSDTTVVSWTDPAPLPEEYTIVLQPGVEIQLDLIFDVPAGVEPTSVEFLYHRDIATGAVGVVF